MVHTQEGFANQVPQMTDPFSLDQAQDAADRGVRLVADMALPESSRRVLHRIFSSCSPIAAHQIAESMSNARAPWPDVQAAFLRAWEFRPTRAEPLHAIARRYREEQRYELGYLFATRAAGIPLPDGDAVLIDADTYTWRAADE